MKRLLITALLLAGCTGEATAPKEHGASDGYKYKVTCYWKPDVVPKVYESNRVWMNKDYTKIFLDGGQVITYSVAVQCYRVEG